MKKLVSSLKFKRWWRVLAHNACTKLLLVASIAMTTWLPNSTWAQEVDEIPDSIEPYDDEADINRLMRKLREFNQLLRAHRLFPAEAVLIDAEKALAQADDALSSHPEYTDVVQHLRNARYRYDEALTAAKTERRNAAVTHFSEDTHVFIKQTKALVSKLQTGSTVQNDVSLLISLIQNGTDIETQSREFADDKAFAKLLTEVHERLSNLQTQLSIANTRHALRADVIKLDETIRAFRQAPSADEALQAALRALDVLEQCEQRWDKRHLVHREATIVRVQTARGIFQADELATLCADEAQKIHRALPDARWNAAVDGLRHRLVELDAIYVEAKELSDLMPIKLQRLRSLIAGYEVCVRESKQLQSERPLPANESFATPLGNHSVTSMAAACQQEADKVTRLLRSAEHAYHSNEFVQSCRNDELAVVQREGIPTQVLTYREGRVFIYLRPESKLRRAITKRFGFTREGALIDYWTAWRDEAVAMLADLYAGMPSKLLAPQNVLLASDIERKVKKLAEFERKRLSPVIDRCQTVLTPSDANPGYDANLVFNTPFGKLSAEVLWKTCQSFGAHLDTASGKGNRPT